MRDEYVVRHSRKNASSLLGQSFSVPCVCSVVCAERQHLLNNHDHKCAKHVVYALSELQPVYMVRIRQCCNPKRIVDEHWNETGIYLTCSRRRGSETTPRLR